ncbi:uncharacterized protein LOC119330102 isoform X2 [Triticum dicoccoides]|uniref:uncharacterized protein LOC119330102 isoform X2 n=1 Tax=Triticum dicoccoides TaxID=85692 RepID=UPI000E7BB707|nr:uncharacterized protein LOC119330102 isoform X2 [Triticum dicoccoides]
MRRRERRASSGCREEAKFSQRSVAAHVHQVCFTRPNPNHGETLSLQEEDVENIVFLGDSELVEDKELGSFTPPAWNEHQPRAVQCHNKGLCTNYNTWILHRRRYYRLIIKGRALSADGQAVLLKIKDIRKEVDLLLEKIRVLEGRPFKIPDVLETDMKLKGVGSSKK